jgi:hypothetical protein
VFAALFDLPMPNATDTEAAPAPQLAEEQACGHG